MLVCSHGSEEPLRGESESSGYSYWRVRRVARWSAYHTGTTSCLILIKLPLMFASPTQDSEKSKVLQSIASVIQAMPPAEEIPAIEVCQLPAFSTTFSFLMQSAKRLL